MFYSISVFCGNYRTRTNRNDKPRAFARGIHATMKQAKAHADALAAHYGQTGPDAEVIYYALPCDIAERRYSLSV